MKRKITLGDILTGVLIVLLWVPQTRHSIQVGLNKLKIAVWSPGLENPGDGAHVGPFTYSLKTVQGESAKIRVGSGRVTFISYWATWCPPCIAELPSIEKLIADYGNRVQFVLVTDEAQETVLAFLDKKGWELPVYLPLMPTPEVLRTNSVPTNYLIDGQGNIIIKETGAANWNSKKVRQVLDVLLSAHKEPHL